MDKNSIYIGKYRVRSYEADSWGMARLVTLMNYLQDAASCHAASQALSVTDLLEKNATWMLLRYHIKVSRYPFEGDEVFVRTWRSAIDGYNALRDFEILNPDRNVIGVATSSWIVMNLKTRRPIRLDKVIGDIPSVRNRALQDDFPPIRKLDLFERELSFRVNMGDLDLNHHVNHSVYVDWAIESVSQDVLMNSVPVEIEVAYRSEARYGDLVLSRSLKTASAGTLDFYHQQIRDGDGKELTRLKTAWRLRKQ